MGWTIYVIICVQFKSLLDLRVPKAQETNSDIYCLLNTLAGAIVLSLIYEVMGSLYSCQNKQATITQKNNAGFKTQLKSE